MAHAAQERRPFTGSHILGNASDLPTRILDYPPFAIPLLAIDYPAELHGSGAIDSIGATVWVEADGRVSRVLVTNGTDIRLSEATHTAITGWRFSCPIKNGQPVQALVRIDVRFENSGMKEVVVRKENEKPALMAGLAPTVFRPKRSGKYK